MVNSIPISCHCSCFIKIFRIVFWAFSIFHAWCMWICFTPWAVMRLHYLWLQKLHDRTIPVNLEAIQTTTIASKLFWPLYLGYNWVLHYIIYGLWLSSFDISLASSDLSTIFKYILKNLNYLQSLQSSTGTASFDIRLQLQHVPSISSVPSDGLKFNHTGSVLFDSVFLRYHGLFLSSVYFNTNFGSIAASRILCSLIRLLRTSQHFLIWQSTSALCLQLVGLSQFCILHVNFQCFKLFPFLPFPFHFCPFITFSIQFVSPLEFIFFSFTPFRLSH